jgi:hypothetical protein
MDMQYFHLHSFSKGGVESEPLTYTLHFQADGTNDISQRSLDMERPALHDMLKMLNPEIYPVVVARKAWGFCPWCGESLKGERCASES